MSVVCYFVLRVLLYCIVLYCTPLYCPVLDCSILPPDMNPFAVNNNDNIKFLPSPTSKPKTRVNQKPVACFRVGQDRVGVERKPGIRCAGSNSCPQTPVLEAFDN